MHARQLVGGAAPWVSSTTGLRSRAFTDGEGGLNAAEARCLYSGDCATPTASGGARSAVTEQLRRSGKLSLRAGRSCARCCSCKRNVAVRALHIVCKLACARHSSHDAGREFGANYWVWSGRAGR